MRESGCWKDLGRIEEEDGGIIEVGRMRDSIGEAWE